MPTSNPTDSSFQAGISPPWVWGRGARAASLTATDTVGAPRGRHYESHFFDVEALVAAPCLCHRPKGIAQRYQACLNSRVSLLADSLLTVVYCYDHDHPNAQDLFLACTLPSAEKAARRKADKLFVQPSDWQVELMYDGAVAAAIEMFQLNPPVSSLPNAFRRYLLRTLSRGMLRSYFMREENCGIRPVGDVRAVRTRKTVIRNTVEREIIARELLDQVTNYANLRPPVRATLQCIAALGPDFALKQHTYTASGDPDKWKRERDRRPILDPDAIAQAMGIPKQDVHRYLC